MENKAPSVSSSKQTKENSSSDSKTVIAVSDYKSVAPDELSIKKKTLIRVIPTNEKREGFIFGEIIEIPEQSIQSPSKEPSEKTSGWIPIKKIKSLSPEELQKKNDKLLKSKSSKSLLSAKKLSISKKTNEKNPKESNSSSLKLKKGKKTQSSKNINSELESPVAKSDTKNDSQKSSSSKQLHRSESAESFNSTHTSDSVATLSSEKTNETTASDLSSQSNKSSNSNNNNNNNISNKSSSSQKPPRPPRPFAFSPSDVIHNPPTDIPPLPDLPPPPVPQFSNSNSKQKSEITTTLTASSSSSDKSKKSVVDKQVAVDSKKGSKSKSTDKEISSPTSDKTDKQIEKTKPQDKISKSDQKDSKSVDSSKKTEQSKVDVSVSVPVSVKQPPVSTVPKSSKVFGVPLENLMIVDGNQIQIPHFIIFCVDYFKSTCMGEQGLFRVPGGASAIASIKDQFNKGSVPDLNKVNPEDVASVFKSFFAELPEPLFPIAYYKDIVSSLEAKTSAKKEKKLAVVIKTMPKHNQYLLEYLIEFLADLASVPQNKMTANNLGIIFGPSVLKQQSKNPADVMREMKAGGELMTFLIERKITQRKKSKKKISGFLRRKKSASLSKGYAQSIQSNPSISSNLNNEEVLIDEGEIGTDYDDQVFSDTEEPETKELIPPQKEEIREIKQNPSGEKTISEKTPLIENANVSNSKGCCTIV